MKAHVIKTVIAISLSIVVSTPTFAQVDDSSLDNSEDLKALSKYVLRLGAYLGYSLDEDPQTKPLKQLINVPVSQLTQIFVWNTALGAMPVNAFSSMLSQFVPRQTNGSQGINVFANYTFTAQPFNQPGADDGKLSVVENIDQKSYQSDPVNQAILNILGTPSPSYCLLKNRSGLIKDCPLLTSDKISENVIGALPGPNDYFKYESIQEVLPQLNSNTLTSPLLFAQPAENQSGSSSQDQKQEKGLPAKNQAQTALNFIRYATDTGNPLLLASRDKYEQLYNKTIDERLSHVEREQAKALLNQYLSSLRGYSAQNSVAISNLYSMLSKRMPQNLPGSSENNMESSQALSEFMMATRRLYNPQEDDLKKQWLHKINEASAATVQKEMAILLAEINYQLYLNRQQQEKILLTNSILLLQNSKNVQPRLSEGVPE